MGNETRWLRSDGIAATAKKQGYEKRSAIALPRGAQRTVAASPSASCLLADETASTRTESRLLPQDTVRATKMPWKAGEPSIHAPLHTYNSGGPQSDRTASALERRSSLAG